MDWGKVFMETISVSYSTILKMTLVIIPLLIAIECLKDMGWLELISQRLKGVTRVLRLPGEAALGMMVGFLVGLIFGSGVIMKTTEEVKMTRTQLNTMFVFIGICHAVIEETVIFTTIGANAGIVFLGRVLTALLFGFGYLWVTARLGAGRAARELTVNNGQ